MEVIPVIDLLNGKAVHAVRGERARYRPVSSCLCGSADPLDLASAYQTQLNTHSLYVADLNGILQGSPDWSTLSRLSQRAAEVWIDAGCATVFDVRELMKKLERGSSQVRLVLPLERIESPSELLRMVHEITAADGAYVFSIDMQAGKSLAGAAWQDQTPRQILEETHKLGISDFLILDLALVGSAGGLRDSSTSGWARDLPQARLAIGGGVRDAGDLEWLRDQGWQAALLATALHQGVIDRSSLAAFCRSDFRRSDFRCERRLSP